MILNGLSGVGFRFSMPKIRRANATQPEYVSTLVVSFPLGEARFGDFPG